jgi:hypothetical protein
MKYDDTDILRVESQGYIGVNENDPQASLHINKVGSNSPILFNDGYYGYGLGGGNMPSDVDPNSNNFRMYMSSTRLHMVTSHSSGQFRWLNGGSNLRMTLDHIGRLGLGLNTTPTKILDITHTDGDGTIMQLRGGAYNSVADRPVGITYNHSVSGNHYAWYLGTKYENSTNEGYNGRRFTLGIKISDGHNADLTNDTYSLMWWNQSDSSATHKGPVDIRKSGGNARHADTALMITNTNASSMTAQMEIMSGNAGYSNLYLGDTNSYSQGGLSYDHTNDNFYFRASNSTKMTLNSTGLGIGTTNPSAKLDVNGSFKAQGTATFQDTATFEGDVDFTNASIEGLPAITVSPTTIFKCPTTATNINFGTSLTKGDILFGTPSTENGTYISHTNNDEKITLKRAGEYEISVTLVVTAQSASNRFTCLTYVEHYNSSNTLLDSYGLEAMYIRSNGANYNSGAMAGQIRIATNSLNTWIKVTSMVLDRESTGTVPLSTVYSKIRIDKIEYNQ